MDIIKPKKATSEAGSWKSTLKMHLGGERGAF